MGTDTPFAKFTEPSIILLSVIQPFADDKLFICTLTNRRGRERLRVFLEKWDTQNEFLFYEIRGLKKINYPYSLEKGLHNLIGLM